VKLAGHGIRVNSLTPTATDAAEARERAARWGVQQWGRAGGDQRRGFLADSRTGSPLGQLPSPRHYAKAAVFLESEDS
jgi:NAD(P)-dependent dehydrogenase (short-subunit alcohol dehydrogenase family)